MPYIYVMNRANGDMKIGFSTDPMRRVTEVFGAQSVLAIWEHDEALQIEQAAHRLLARHRQDGEWFSVTRYAAFRAIARAMETYDALQPQERLIDLTGDFAIPPPPQGLDPNRHRLGYLRPLREVHPGQQMKWLLAAGVSHLDVYIESGEPGPVLDAAMKDCRDGDLFFVWSPAVFGGREGDILVRIRDRNADMVTAL